MPRNNMIPECPDSHFPVLPEEQIWKKILSKIIQKILLWEKLLLPFKPL